jgi:cob(I)alamin adenosyltransferase
MLSELAATTETAGRFMKIDDGTVFALEKMIEKYALQTQIPDQFILPGDTSASAAISVARTIARRAERRLVEYGKKKPEIRKILFKYLNRLSSFLYILEIYTIQSQTPGDLSLVKKKA